MNPSLRDNGASSSTDLGKALDPGESEAKDDKTEETEDPHHDDQDEEPGVVGGDAVVPDELLLLRHQAQPAQLHAGVVPL